YYSWGRFARRGTARPFEAVATAAALVACLWMGNAFVKEAAHFHEFLTDDFRASSWVSLGERMSMAMPEGPIAERVHAIREELRPGEKLLVLSPFDHVLSFYVNPRGLCGHFDVLTNLATHKDAEAVMECVWGSEKLLVVYDRALETPCLELLRT